MKELDAIRKAMALGLAVRSFSIGDIAVEFRGLGSWAVLDGGHCLNRDGGWEREPLPSSRTEEFMSRCRFSLDEAVEMAAAAHREGRR